MVAMVEIPDGFREEFKKGRFQDALARLSADANMMAGKHEKETADMLIKAFRKAEVLPCKLGDELWIKDYGSNLFKGGRVSMLQQKKDGAWRLRVSCRNGSYDFTMSDIGKYVFLTYEDARKSDPDAHEGTKTVSCPICGKTHDVEVRSVTKTCSVNGISKDCTQFFCRCRNSGGMNEFETKEQTSDNEARLRVVWDNLYAQYFNTKNNSPC